METEKLIYKLFGYSREDIMEKLAEIGGDIGIEVEEKYLDAKITLTCPVTEAHRLGIIVGNAFYGAIYSDEDVSLAKCIIDRLAFYGRSLSVAESLTGGLVTDRLVSVPGCSEVLIEGLVTYSNASKAARLGVDNRALSMFGAVSAEVARQMATGLVKAGADIAVSTTGIAGPSGGSDEKPVGLTYIGIADEMKVTANEFLFKGDREEVRNLAANTALFLLWKRIVKPNDFENMVIE